jgi:hypothetical protein
MATLNSWQKISRVISGSPWGDGADGSATISTDPNTRATITGTATQNTGTAGSTAFANGDLVILHQTQGTGAGQWEVNRVSSGGGTTSLTFQVAHQYTYGTGAQIIKVPRYTTATVSAHSVTAWGGTTGGVEVICAKSNITVSGALSAASLGFRGGVGNATNNANAQQGESPTGIGANSTSANGFGGGGGNNGEDGGKFEGGGGGGFITAGTAGTSNDSAPFNPGGSAGGSGGSTDLTTIFFGGAGGAAGNKGASGNTGANSGGIIILISKSITVSGSAASNGGNGLNAAGYSGGSGAGAGGSCLLVCDSASIGTNLVTAIGGTGGTGANGTGTGGNGGSGSIAIHHKGTVTGTTNPTFTDVTDATLVEAVGGAFLYNLI